MFDYKITLFNTLERGLNANHCFPKRFGPNVSSDLHAINLTCVQPFCISPIFQGWEAWPHAHLDEILNPSTSAEPVMAKLQNLFVAVVNGDTIQMTLKLRLLTVYF